MTTAANASSQLGLGEEEMLWLTVRIAEAACQVDPNIEVLVGLSQPWGDYMPGIRATIRRSSSRTPDPQRLESGGLNVEMVMGVWPRGSYCRDFLDVSRMIDLYSLLGIPLQITLGLPSASGTDALASPDFTVQAGQRRGGFTPDVQADWAEDFAALALCKPSVRAVQWVHLSDAEPHLFPAAGLVDAQGNIKPALARLRELRKAHLR